MVAMQYLTLPTLKDFCATDFSHHNRSNMKQGNSSFFFFSLSRSVGLLAEHKHKEIDKHCSIPRPSHADENEKEEAHELMEDFRGAMRPTIYEEKGRKGSQERWIRQVVSTGRSCSSTQRMIFY